MESASTLWSQLESDRAPFLDTAIQCSKLTIPSLIPNTDVDTRQRYSEARPSRHLYQSLGSRGLSNVSSKLLNTLIPFSQPFFRLCMDQAKIDAYAQQQGGDQESVYTQIDSYLATQEIGMLRKIDKLKVRASMFEAMKHLACGGTGLLYVKESGLRFYGLRQIVGERDADDNIKLIIIRERLSERYLPKVAQRLVPKAAGSDSDRSTQDSHDLYTIIEYDPDDESGKQVQWHQEYNDKMLRGTAGFSTLDKSPWIPLRLNKVSGSFYGTGLVEELLGDLTSYNQLSKAITQAGLGAAKTVWLVNPNGVTRADALNRAENFSFVPGDEADVKALTVGKQSDYQTGFSVMQGIERRLNFAFLNTQAIQREAERVTSEEIKTMVGMLEESFGGIYTMLSDELQLPLIRRIMFMMKQSGELQSIPDGLVEPQIVAGADAIGRGSDKQRLVSFFSFIQGAFGPDAVIEYTNPLEGIRRAAAAEGVATKDLLVSQKDLDARKKQNEQLQLAGQLAQNGTNVTPQPQPPTAPGPPAPTGAPAGGPAIA